MGWGVIFLHNRTNVCSQLITTPQLKMIPRDTAPTHILERNYFYMREASTAVSQCFTASRLHQVEEDKLRKRQTWAMLICREEHVPRRPRTVPGWLLVTRTQLWGLYSHRTPLLKVRLRWVLQHLKGKNWFRNSAELEWGACSCPALECWANPTKVKVFQT